MVAMGLVYYLSLAMSCRSGRCCMDPVGDLETIRAIRRVQSGASHKLLRLCLEDGVFPGPVRIESRLTLQEDLAQFVSSGHPQTPLHLTIRPLTLHCLLPS